MRKNKIHQIHSFQLWDRTRRVATAIKGMKTAITVKKKTAAEMGTVSITRKETAAMIKIVVMMGIAAEMRTLVAVAGAPKIFKNETIIVEGKKTATMASRTSGKDSAASFNG